MKSHLIAISLVASVGACGSTIVENEFTEVSEDALAEPAIGEVTRLSDGTYEIDTGSETIALPQTTATVSGQPSWLFGGDGTILGSTYQSANVLAVGGIFDDRAFGAISGTREAPPVMNVTYEGRIVIAEPNASYAGPVVLAFDSAAGTLTAAGDIGSSASYTVAGVVSGSDIGGDVTFNGETAPLEGGFFGTDETVGTFASDAFGGLFYGEATP